MPHWISAPGVFVCQSLKISKPWLLNSSAPILLNCCMPEDFAQTRLIEGRRGLRRRPLWEFEISTATPAVEYAIWYPRLDRFWR